MKSDKIFNNCFKIILLSFFLLTLFGLISCSSKEDKKSARFIYNLNDEISNISIELTNSSVRFTNSNEQHIEIVSKEEIPYTFEEKKLEIKNDYKDFVEIHIFYNFEKSINQIKYIGNITRLTINGMMIGCLIYESSHSHLNIDSSIINSANISAKMSNYGGANFGSNKIDSLIFNGDYVYSLEIYNNTFKELDIKVLTGKMVFGYTKFNSFNCNFIRGVLHIFLYNDIGYQINANVPGFMQFDFVNDAVINGSSYTIGQPECVLNLSNSRYITYIYKIDK